MFNINEIDKSNIEAELKRLRYGVFEGLDDYYMIHIDKVTPAHKEILDRYFFAEKITDEDEKKKQLSIIRSMIQAQYMENKKLRWIDVKEFVLQQKVNKTEEFQLDRPHVGFLNEYRIRVDSLTKINDTNEFKLVFQAQWEAFDKISKIPECQSVAFRIEPDKVNWNIYILDFGSTGYIHNIKESKDKRIGETTLIIKKID